MDANIDMIVWCTQKRVNFALENGISSWKDPNLCANVMNLRGKQARIVDNIICANRDNVINDITYCFDEKEVYLDIENINDTIFMIGIWFNGEFKQWTIPKLNSVEELKMLNEYNLLIKSINPARIYIWSNHEKSMFKKKNLQYNLDLDLDIMFDFCDYLSSNAYAIPGLFNYKLKSVGKLFYKNGFIEHTWSDDIIDGKQAMEQAQYYYDNGIALNDIEYYNFIDVKVMQEIVYYFKNKIEN